MASYSTQNPLNLETSVNHATFKVSGFKQATVRMEVGGFEMGFATLAYSGNLTDALKEYSAERITLALHYVKGWTNTRIQAELDLRSQQYQVLNSSSSFRLGCSSRSELLHDMSKLKRCIRDYEEELLKPHPDKVILLSLLEMMGKPINTTLKESRG